MILNLRLGDCINQHLVLESNQIVRVYNLIPARFQEKEVLTSTDSPFTPTWRMEKRIGQDSKGFAATPRDQQ